MLRPLLAVALSVGASLGTAAADPTLPATPATDAVSASTAGMEAVYAAPSPAVVARGPLSTGWNRHFTDHFLVAFTSDAYRERAQRQGQLLESTYNAFYGAFLPHDFGVGPTSRRLVCLYFDDKDDYLHYAKRVDRVDMSWTVAYYSARTNRIAFYRYGRAEADDARNKSTTRDDLYGNAAADDTHAAGDQRVALASATHEAAHQLAFNSGLQKRGVMYPLWVSEGLATNFELQHADGELGPAADNASRRERLVRLKQDEELQPLSTFVWITRPPTGDAVATDAAYAQSWGLFRFLYEKHRTALSNYLATVRELPRGGRDRYTLRGEFTDAFGPIAAIESEWHAWIDELGQQEH